MQSKYATPKLHFKILIPCQEILKKKKVIIKHKNAPRSYFIFSIANPFRHYFYAFLLFVFFYSWQSLFIWIPFNSAIFLTLHKFCKEKRKGRIIKRIQYFSVPFHFRIFFFLWQLFCFALKKMYSGKLI